MAHASGIRVPASDLSDNQNPSGNGSPLQSLVNSVGESVKSAITSAVIDNQADLDASVIRIPDLFNVPAGLEVDSVEYFAAAFTNIFQQYYEHDMAMLRRLLSRPAKIETLTSVMVTEEELKKDVMTCAVCQDEMGVGQDIRELPCNHRYHGDCIIPWLGKRNTCPLCRSQLHTVWHTV